MKQLLFHIIFVCLSSNLYAGIGVKKIADLPKGLDETSGLELYKNKYLLTHNDSGNEPILFLLDLQGELINKIRISNAPNTDWEDIAIDDVGNVYLADIGNNYNNRKDQAIYIIKSKDIEKMKSEVKADKITIKYKDQSAFPPGESKLNYDAEALIWKDGQLHILTKCRTVPFSGKSFVYSFPAKAGHYDVKPRGHIQFCDNGWRSCSVTAADYDSKSGTLTVLLYGKLYLISNFPKNRFWEGDIKSFNISGIKQREGICYGSTSSTLYMTDEYRKPIGGGNLYKITIK